MLSYRNAQTLLMAMQKLAFCQKLFSSNILFQMALGMKSTIENEIQFGQTKYFMLETRVSHAKMQHL